MSEARVERARSMRAELGLDALLITDPLNRRYLTGHSGGDHGLAESGGVVLISRNEAILLADRNNLDWAKSEADAAFEVMVWERPWIKSVAKIAAERGWTSIGFEDSAMLVSTHRALMDELGPERALAAIDHAVSRLRASKDDHELANLRRAIDLTDRVFVEVTSELAPGITELGLAQRFDDAFRAGGAEGVGFPTIVASGPNAARPHHASSDRIIQANEPVIVDMGAVVGGYTADLTRTIWLGEPTERFRTVYNSVSRAHAAALARVRAGAPLADVDWAARRSLAADGFEANVIHSVGHGIGLAIHEAPSVSIYAEGTLQARQVITIEPGIYFPNWGGVRIEDVVVVTPDGHELLSAAPK